MHVYEKVRAYIEHYGLKQKAVAQRANISASTFSAMMNGKRTMYADDLRAICYALGVGSETFIDIHNPRPYKPPENRTA